MGEGMRSVAAKCLLVAAVRCIGSCGPRTLRACPRATNVEAGKRRCPPPYSQTASAFSHGDGGAPDWPLASAIKAHAQ